MDHPDMAQDYSEMGKNLESKDDNHERLWEDLRNHQMELELQNEELQRIQGELEKSRDQYLNLYHSAPVAYVSLDSAGFVMQGNRTFADMMNLERVEQQNFLSFVIQEDHVEFLTFFARLRKSRDDRITSELRLKRHGGGEFYVRIEGRLLGEKETRIHSREIARFALSDVTKEKKMSENLAESERRYRLLNDFASDFIYWRNPNQELGYVSPASVLVTGYEPENFLQDPRLLDDIVHPEDRHIWDNHEHRFRPGMPVEPLEFRILTRSGEVRWIGHVCQDVYDNAGNLIGVRGSHTDITSRRHMEEQLRERERLFRQFFETGLIGMAFLSREGKWEAVNERLSCILHCPRLDLEGQDWGNYLHPEDKRKAEKVFAPLFEGRREKETHVLRFVSPEGKAICMEIFMRAVTNEEGQTVRIMALLQDITDRRHAETRLSHHQSGLEALVFLSQMAEDTRDEELGRYVLEKAVELTESRLGNIFLRESKEEEFQLMAQWLEGQAGPMDNRAFEKCCEPCAPVRLALQEKANICLNDFPTGDVPENCFVCEQERLNLRRVLAVPVKEGGEVMLVATLGNKREDYNDTDQRLLSLLADGLWKFIKRKRSSESLKEALTQAEGANRVKNEFLASMSHEIRTPLNGVIGMTEMALRTELNAEQRKYLNTAQSSARSLLRIINDILDFSKIEAGQIDIEPSHINLAELVEDVRAVMEPRVQEKGVELRMDVSPDLPAVVKGDPVRLRQVLFNLLGNAVKFTDAGYCGLRVYSADFPERGDSLEVTFEVEDTGIGIAPEKRRVIFKTFSQADQSISRKYGGTGLGLAISQRLVHIMGGEIEVTSAPEKGSCFRFTLPLGIPQAEKEVVKVEEQGGTQSGEMPTGLRLLLAEDNPVNQELAKAMLEMLGHEVVFANNGQEAVNLFGSETFDLIFMDIEMPGMDGMEATRLIREGQVEGPNSPDIPIVAMTAHALKGDRERFLEHGMNQYISKPVELDILEQVIGQVCNPEG